MLQRPLSNKFMTIQRSVFKLPSYPYSLSKAILKPSFRTLGSHRPFHAVTDTKKVMHSRVNTYIRLSFIRISPLQHESFVHLSAGGARPQRPTPPSGYAPAVSTDRFLVIGG